MKLMITLVFLFKTVAWMHFKTWENPPYIVFATIPLPEWIRGTYMYYIYRLSVWQSNHLYKLCCARYLLNKELHVNQFFSSSDMNMS